MEKVINVSRETFLHIDKNSKTCYTQTKRDKEAKMSMDEEGTTLATEIFRELKTSARRWFIAFLVMCGIEIATVSGFLWYISLPVDETVTVENQDGNANYIGGDVGGNVNNNGKDNSTQEERTPETETLVEG